MVWCGKADGSYQATIPQKKDKRKWADKRAKRKILHWLYERKILTRHTPRSCGNHETASVRDGVMRWPIWSDPEKKNFKSAVEEEKIFQ